MNLPTVAEIVTFRLVPGVTPEAFTEAADSMTAFLQSTGAMISRTLSADPQGWWTDHIAWTTSDAARKAAKAMFDRPEAKPFMEMIEQEGMRMRHAEIALYLPPE